MEALRAPGGGGQPPTGESTKPEGGEPGTETETALFRQPSAESRQPTRTPSQTLAPVAPPPPPGMLALPFGAPPMRSFALAFALALLPHSAHAQVATPNPVVERLEPTSGPPGTEVQMIGRNFRSDQTVSLGGVAVEVRSRLPNRWAIVIPVGATSGRLEIRLASGTAITGPEFRVTAAAPPPVITSIAPTTATVGSEVRIAGENFSPRATDDTVTLNGLPVVVRQASPTELVVLVPTGATGGPFVVRVAGSGEASSPPVTISAGLTITSFSPAVAAPGMEVTIAGTGFLARPAHNRLFVGSTAMRVVRASATSLVAVVPEGAASGTLLVELHRGGRTTSASPLTVRAMPTIAEVAPASGVIGAEVRVRGTGFGTDIRAVSATLGGAPLTLRALTDTELTFEIPSGAATGTLAFAVGGLPAVDAPAPFTVLVPLSLGTFAPINGPAGTEVAIAGTGFSTVLTDNRVTLAGLPCEVVAATGTELRVRVPATTSGPFAVEVLNAGTARTSQPFVVTTPPVIAAFEPALGEVGATLRITGTRFGTNPSLLEVTVGGVRATVRSATDTSIEASIPAGAATGRVAVTVRLQGTSTSATDFRVLAPFAVSAAAPASAYPAQAVTIRGAGFGAGTTVRFSGVEAPVPATVVSATEIRAYVPEGAATGTISVRTDDGREASTPFELAAAPEGTAITSVGVDCRDARRPERPGRSCRLTVRGHGLGTRATSRLSIAGSRVRIRTRSVTPYVLEAEIPRSTPAAPLHLEIRGARGSEPVVADSASVTFE